MLSQPSIPLGPDVPCESSKYIQMQATWRGMVCKSLASFCDISPSLMSRQVRDGRGLLVIFQTA